MSSAVASEPTGLSHADWAFWALCGVFATVVAAQLWLFRRRGWFGR